MIDKYREKIVNDAVRRLREAAYLRVVRDANGRVLHEGAPTFGHIRAELNRIYRMARARAKNEAGNDRQ